MSEPRLDAVILTAITLEYEATTKVEAGASPQRPWRHEKVDGLPVAFREFLGRDGLPLRVAVAQAGSMGVTAALAVLVRLVDRYRPHVIGMCGVCAGHPTKTSLGDVVAAERLFFHDTGKQRAGETQQDVTTYNLRDDWKLAIEHTRFADRFSNETWWKERPIPYRWQELWTLERLLAGVDPTNDPARATSCLQWKQVIGTLWRSGDVEDGTLVLTARGRKRIERVLIEHGGTFPDLSPTTELMPFRVHVAPMGSGSKVVEDPQIWPLVSQHMRKVLGLEMEAAALGALVHARVHHEHRLDAVVMKGVMDFADDGRDDHFKEYAARASAECLIAFLRDNVTPVRPPAGEPIARDASDAQAASPPHVSLGHLTTRGGLLVGRDAELRKLDLALGGPERRTLLAFIACGGAGKTTLVGQWLADIACEGYRGMRRVLGWSFYSQGTSEERGASADEFVAWALGELGDPQPSAGSPFDKASRLAKLVKLEPTLLVVDGVEPLQYPPGPAVGRLRDRSIAVFLRELSAHNPGLCVVTSRLALTDLDAYIGRTAEQVDLSQLEPEAGAEVLAQLGVIGPRAELRTASIEFGGHALALTLLGRYLVDAFEGDVRRRGEVGPLAHEEVHGGQARRVMTSYEHWFKSGPEREMLHVLGMFDRPAERRPLRAIRALPAIPRLTDHLAGLSNREWNLVLSRLRSARLVEPVDRSAPDTVDAHPLVREHFSDALRHTCPDAWRAGHLRLYEYYKASATDQPRTLAELAPSYTAVTHGCHAGVHEDAFEEVYLGRIQRGEAYATRKLGAYGMDLAALAGFFEEPWRCLVPALADRPTIFSDAGDCLGALGRLREATELVRVAFEAHAAECDWDSASTAAGNLSVLHQHLGELDLALSYAESAVELADRGESAFSRTRTRATLGDVLHQMGCVAESARQFADAETIQRKRQPKYPLLYSAQGYEYCKLLLALGRVDDVRQRANQTLVWVGTAGGLVDTAFNELLLGLVYSARMPAGCIPSRELARRKLDEAVDGLRRSGMEDFVPAGLLARAEFFVRIAEFGRARIDFDEALEIAARGPMRLYEADAHLGLVRLFLACGEPEVARGHFDVARRIVEETGYGRRRPEVEALAGQFVAPE